MPKSEPGLKIGGKTIPYKTLAIGGAAALALFLITRKGGTGGGTTAVPLFPGSQAITTEVPVAPDLNPITDQLEKLQKEYGDLLGSVAGRPYSYKVQKGDTLESIAAKFGNHVKDITRLNPWLGPFLARPNRDFTNVYGRFLMLPGTGKI